MAHRESQLRCRAPRCRPGRLHLVRRWLGRGRPPAPGRVPAPIPVALLVEDLEPRILYSTFTVTSTADPHFLGFPLALPGTLRWAIDQANANPGFDTIAFDIGGGGVQTIGVGSELSAITDAVLIDGTTQGGYAGEPLIVIDGSSAGWFSNGFELHADGNTLRGLVIHSFGVDGIEIHSDGNVIEGNYIGVDVDGVTGRGNRDDGIDTVTASFNVIRGNLIGDNREDGVDLYEAGSHDNVVQGNWIGTDKTGTINLGNRDHGVYISDSLFGGDSHDNVIGGAGVGEGNVIAFNRIDGINVEDGDRNTIRGNAIYDNNGDAIDLDGSANDGQPRPTLTGAFADPASTRILGTFSSSPGELHQVDFFTNPDADREGRVYLGSASVTTDGAGVGSFDQTFAAVLTPGHYVTATVTDSVGNTSEFSSGIRPNVAPTANADAYSVVQGGTLVEGAPGVLDNDTDPEADPLTATLVSGPSRGLLVLNPDGSFSYTRTNPGLAADSFTYRTQDATGVSNVATVTLTVTPQQPPTANDDPGVPGAYATDEDTVLNVGAAAGVLANDTDPELDPLSVQSLDTSGTVGAVVLNADGSFSYDPRGATDYLAAGETLNDVFHYTVSDGNGGIDTASVTVVVTGVNDDPGATSNTGDVDADGAAPAVGNVLTDNDGSGVDTDPDTSDTLGVSQVNGVIDPATDVTGSYGTLDWQADGSYSYAVDPGNVAVQALGAGQTLQDVFTYTASDGNGGADSATLTITIHGQDQPPVATDNASSVAEDAAAPVAGNLITDDDGAGVDSDPDAGDTLNVVLVNGVSNPFSDVVGLHGTLDWELNGAYAYSVDNSDPAVQALSVGQTLTDVFAYTLRDSDGLTDTATLTITITGTNDGPTATANTATVAEDAAAPAAGNVLTDDDGAGLDSDPDAGDSLSVSGIDGVTNPATDVIGAHGSLDWEANGAYAYSVDNTDPAVQALAIGQTLTDVFSYTVSDGQGGTDTATLTVTITGGNDGPTATANLASVTEGDVAPVAGNVIGDDDGFGVDSDPDAGTTLVVSGVDGVTDPATDVVGAHGTLDWATDGSYAYTLDNTDPAVIALNSGDTLTDLFTYTLVDGDGGTDTATLTVTIQGSNGLPGATANLASVAEDAAAPVTGNVLTDDDGFGVDSDPDPGDVLSVGGVDGITNPATDVVGTYGTLDWEANGAYSYAVDNGNAAVQALALGETLTDVFTYTVSDGNGGTDTATLTVTITGANDGPTATANTATLAEDAVAPATGNVLTDDDGAGIDTDPDASDVLTVSGVDGVTNPATDVVGTYGTLDWEANGAYSYAVDNGNAAVQALALGETLTDVFTYTVSDGNGGTDTATLTVTITGANDGPTATANTATLAEDAVAPATGNVLTDDDGAGIDTDPDASDVLTVGGIDGVTNPATDVVGTYGTLDWEANGSYGYAVDNTRPAVQALAAGESLTDVFTYTVADGNGGSGTATLTVTISGANDAPVITGGLAFPVDANWAAGTVVGRVEAMDPDGSDTLTFQLAPGPASAFFEVLPTGEIVYLGATPLAGPAGGLAVLDVQVLDAPGGTPVHASVQLDVTPVPVVVVEPPLEPPAPGPVATAEPGPPVAGSPGARPVATLAEPLVLAAGSLGSLDDAEDAAPELRLAELEPPRDPVATVVRGGTGLHDHDEPDAGIVLERAALELGGEDPAGFAQQVIEEEQHEAAQASVIATAAVALSAGFLSFLLRGGSLLAALLASLPVWHRVDVLAVLALSDKERKKREADIARQEAAELQENEALAALFGDGPAPARWADAARPGEPPRA